VDSDTLTPAGARVLIVDDDAASRRLLRVRLEAMGCAVAAVADGSEALAEIRKHEPGLMLLDLQMPKMGGIEVLKELAKQGTKFPVVVISAHGSIESAVDAMKQGAYDFITKPIDAKHFEIVVRKALEREGLKRGLELLTEETDSRHRLIVGQSKRMAEATETARKAADSKATVLLLGESGTGKEIFARAIHNWSDRKSQPFVVINCVGLSKELLESELFGHEKGAFTGADQQKKGKMELANGGTVFLDEIGDMSQELQTKLLRFLQEREFDRVGGVRPIHVDVRIICATNRDLEAAVKEGRFRQDLYHRINVIPITLPPLRERVEDIPVLAHHFVEYYAKEAKKNFTEIVADALKQLCSYDWPGNVRELGNAIERAIVLGHGPCVTVQDLPSRVVASVVRPPIDGRSYRDAMEDHRKQLILVALERCRGNRAAAARLLGLHEKYFLRLLKSLDISV
jgi:DNA-binding NtrC family response regulator